jgi:hypothetical protein
MVPRRTAAGPVFTAAEDWIELTAGNLVQFAKGKETSNASPLRI